MPTSELAYVHIVDGDLLRRTQMARQLYQNQIHAEIYESLEELVKRPPTRGAMLVSDELISKADVLAGVQLNGGYIPLAFFSSHPSRARIVAGMSSGALDFLEWPCPTDELVATVRRIAEAGLRRAPREKLRVQAERLVEHLSAREAQVLELLIQGSSNKAVAAQLSISPRTVEIHRSNLMAKLGANSIADAIRIGIYAGLDRYDLS